MKFFRLVSDALHISFTHKILWALNLIPTAFLLVGGIIFTFAFYTPVMNLYVLFGRAGGESMTVLALIEEQVINGLSFVIPLLVVFLAMAIIAKNATIKSIQLIAGGQSVDFKTAWKESRGYFGTTVLLVVCIVGFSLALHLIEVYLRQANVGSSTLTIVNLIMEIVIIFSSLFSLHYVLIHNDPALLAMRKSFHFTTSNFYQLLGLFLFLLAGALLVVCLMGAVVGISYYVSIVVGLLVGLLMMIALIPVNIFLTTVWTLFFVAFGKMKDSH